MKIWVFSFNNYVLIKKSGCNRLRYFSWFTLTASILKYTKKLEQISVKSRN